MAKRCPSCNTENRDDAKFCKGCGASIPIAAPQGDESPASVLACPACGHTIRPESKFCAKCGAALGKPVTATRATPPASPAPEVLPQTPRQPEPVAVRTAPVSHHDRIASSDIPVTQQKVARNRKWVYILLTIAIGLIAIGGGSYFVIQQREEQRLALERANEERQRALAAAEQARKLAEEQAAELARQKEEAENKQRELEAQRREAEMRQREAELRRQAADVQRRETEARRLEQEARDRQALAAAEARNRELARLQQDAARRAAEERQRAATAVQPPRLTVVQLCSNQRNIFSRSACEVRECRKPEHQNDLRCRQIREAAERQR